MAKASTGSSKPAPRKKAATKKAAPKKTLFRSLLNPNETSGSTRALVGTPITGFMSIFNPDTGNGGIRIEFGGGQYKDFNGLNAAMYTAALTALRGSQATYNGQYILNSN
jgi:hypothetical protein